MNGGEAGVSTETGRRDRLAATDIPEIIRE
jgi:hypothetical protein